MAEENCPTYGYVIADENSDLYCYTMMVLNYLYGSNITKLSLDEYYHYLEYLRTLGYSDKFIAALQTIVIPQKNENISQYLDELSSEQVYRSRESVYQYVKNKKTKVI